MTHLACHNFLSIRYATCTDYCTQLHQQQCTTLAFLHVSLVSPFKIHSIQPSRFHANSFTQFLLKWNS